jgi:protease IV
LKNSRRWLILAILLLCVVAIPVGLFSGKISSHAHDSDDDESSASDLTLPFRDRIQLIRLNGLIADGKEDSILSNMYTANSALKQLRKAVKDKHVKAVLLRINSPGGTVSASQEISDEIGELRLKGKPVVVSMADLAASGGYYIASAADKIVAEPGTLTGSIGVILSTINLKGLGDKLGLQPQVIKSGPFKDIGSPYRPMTPEEKALLQTLINDSYEQFVGAVAAGRKMPVDEVKKLADGRVYSGKQALKLGLVDKLGGYDTACLLLQDICKERYQLKRKLPVEEVGADSFIAGLFDSSNNFLHLVRKDSLASNLFDGLLPEFMQSRFYHQPLWIMQ